MPTAVPLFLFAFIIYLKFHIHLEVFSFSKSIYTALVTLVFKFLDQMQGMKIHIPTLKLWYQCSGPLLLNEHQITPIISLSSLFQNKCMQSLA